MFYLFPGPLSAPVQPRLRLASFNFRSSRFCRNSSLTILRISIAFPPTCRCSSCFVAQANVPKSRHSSLSQARLEWRWEQFVSPSSLMSAYCFQTSVFLAFVSLTFFVTSVWKEGHKDTFVSLYAIFYADSIVDCAVSPGSDQSAVPPRKQAGSRAGRLSRTYFRENFCWELLPISSSAIQVGYKGRNSDTISCCLSSHVGVFQPFPFDYCCRTEEEWRPTLPASGGSQLSSQMRTEYDAA